MKRYLKSIALLDLREQNPIFIAIKAIYPFNKPSHGLWNLERKVLGKKHHHR
jgi:hypothetical protein